MRAWIGALVVGLSLGCSDSGAPDGGGAGSGGAVGGRGGQAGGVAGQAGGGSGSGGATDGGLSGCERLVGLSFDSIDEHECGLAPPDSGASLCHWRINFKDQTTFTWRHSDYIEAGSYTCSANTIVGQTQTSGSHTATLDSALWRFTWDGVVYACTSCPP